MLITLYNNCCCEGYKECVVLTYYEHTMNIVMVIKDTKIRDYNYIIILMLINYFILLY